MNFQFEKSNPIQTAKFTAISVAFLIYFTKVLGLIPGQGLLGLLLMIVFGLGIAFVIIGESVIAGYRAMDSSDSLRDQFGERPAYVIVRTIEAIGAVASAIGFVFFVVVLPQVGVSGFAYMALFLIFVPVLGMTLLIGCLIRTATEVYYFQRNSSA